MNIVMLMAQEMGVSTEYIIQLSKRTEKSYKKYYIKQRGKDKLAKPKGRKIYAPSPELSLVQGWIAGLVTTSFFHNSNMTALPNYVTAYEKGSSIVNNAKLHVRNNHIISFDIHNFFPSCRRDKVEELFGTLVLNERDTNRKRNLTTDEIGLLTELSCCNGGLVVGSPSSPFLANRIMLPVDMAIQRSLPEGYVYSRYSDDITISSADRIDKKAITDIVKGELENNNFILNEAKTRCAGKGSPRRITGVYLTSENTLSIGRQRKNELKSALYKYLTKQSGNRLKILGMLFFCKQVEPSYFNRVVAKYSCCGIASQMGGVIPALRCDL